ncbi:MAG: T9SS type A sorting domain-containing protein [Ignavibacteriae bacterium]|nr:T9SS type A sorting domain-containing protein [Ignavibacteriota bacterium]
MKNVYGFFVFIFLLNPLYLFPQGWTQQNIASGSNNLNSAYAISPRTCIIAGGYIQDLATNIYTVYRTTNRGVNWGAISTGGAFYFTSVQFIDSLTGYAGGGAYFIMPENMVGKCLYKTTNGGANWNSAISFVMNGSTSIDIKDIHFINSQTGWTCALDGTIGKTTNGGTNYTQYSTSTAFAKYSIFFINSLTGWTCGASGNTAKSTNGGINWSTIQMTSTVTLNSIYFADANTGYVCGNGGFIYKTTNGGANWTMKPSISTANMYSVHFYNADKGWVAGTNVVLGTSNGGNSWTMQFTGTANLNSVHFCDSLNGWATGGNKVLGSVTGGWTGVLQPGNYLPSESRLIQNYPNPFNSMTKVKFQMLNSGTAQIIIYDILGKEIKILFKKVLTGGVYEVSVKLHELPSGIYSYSLIIDGVRKDTRKFVLIK